MDKGQQTEVQLKQASIEHLGRQARALCQRIVKLWNFGDNDVSTGPAERLKSWLGHPYMVGINLRSGQKRVKVANKRWLKLFPTVPLYSAGHAVRL